MRLIYIVSIFIILLVALITPRKEYFNLKEPCYKNIGNKNDYGDEITFNNLMLEDVLSKDSQIIKGDSYNDEITNNLREFEAQKKLAILDVQQKEASVAAEKSKNNNFFDLQIVAQQNMENKISLEKSKLDQKMNNAKNNVSKYVNNRIMQDGQAKLSNTVQDIITRDITNIGLQLSKGETVPNYNFNGYNMLKNQFDSFTIDNTQIKVNNDKMVVPVKLLKPKGCYTVNDYDAILQWSPIISGCESFGIKEKDYWKNNWNNFAVITSVDPGGKLPFATLGGKDVWLLQTFTENSTAIDYVNSFNRTIFDWQSYPDPKGSFPIRVNPITTNIECLEKSGRCDTSFGSDMSKINNNANTIKCKFNDSDPLWCKKVYNEFANKNLDSLNYNTCPIGWKVIDSSKNICDAGVNKSLQCRNYNQITYPNCNNCKKIQRNEVLSLIDKCDAQFRFKPNANAIANNQVGIKESVDQSVRDVLGTSTKPISSNADRFDFHKKGILVKIYEAVKSNNIIVKGPAVGPRNYGEGNTVYIVNNINFVNSTLLLDAKFTEFQQDIYRTKQVYVEFLGYIKIPENTEKVTFQTDSSQGSRFYFQIGDELINVIDSWSSPGKKASKTFNVKPNSYYPFKLEYFLDQGISNIKLLWRLNNNTNFNVISRDNFFLDTEQCNKLTDIPQFNTTLDKEYKTFPGISAVNTSSIKMGNFETADECALNCSSYENCRAFTYSMDDKSCYQFDPDNPKFFKDENTNTYIKNNTQSVYGSYDNSLEVPMRKMLTITDRDNSIQLSGLNEILKKNFTIEMWINVDSKQPEDIYLFSINPLSEDKGEKIILNLNKNRILDVDFGYPNNPKAIDVVGDINPNRQNSNKDGNETFADYQGHDISPNVWTHVAMTYSNNIVKIYVNGDKKKEIRQGPFTSSNNRLLSYIGKSSGYRAYKLHIDEIRIWSIDLNTETLKSHMKKELDNTHPNKNNLGWYSNLNGITNKQIYNKCTPKIGSGCIQNIIAKFNKEPINITSESPLA